MSVPVSNFKIRPATLTDADELCLLYAYYVEHSAASFEWVAPDAGIFQSRMEKILQCYPYLVIESEKRLLGYAYASALNERKAYAWSAEMSIYIDKDARKKGLGRRLYMTLEDLLIAQGIHNVYACIAYSEQEDEYLTHASVHFHERLGFSRAGLFHSCGYKFGRWYDIIWMNKRIAPSSAQPHELRAPGTVLSHPKSR